MSNTCILLIPVAGDTVPTYKYFESEANERATPSVIVTSLTKTGFDAVEISYTFSTVM